METILALPSDKSTTAKIVIATSFYERFPLISNLDIDTILDNCVLDRTFYISTITNRELEGEVSSTSSMSKTAGEIAKRFAKLLFEENSRCRVSKACIEKCYAALVPAIFRYKPGSYKSLYGSIKSELPSSETSEYYIGQVAFKRVDKDEWLDFIDYLKVETDCAVSSNTGGVDCRFSSSSAVHLLATDMLSPIVVKPSRPSFCVNESSVSGRSTSITAASAAKSFISPPSFSFGTAVYERSTSSATSTPVLSGISRVTTTSSGIPQEIIQPAVVLDEEGCFIHFGLPIETLELNDFTCPPPHQEAELRLFYFPHSVKCPESLVFQNFNIVAQVCANIANNIANCYSTL
jgi:hypothetical protein